MYPVNFELFKAIPHTGSAYNVYSEICSIMKLMTGGLCDVLPEGNA